jgi:Heparinase II/III-like protein.
MLYELLRDNKFGEKFKGIDVFNPFPRYDDREAWNKFSEADKEYMIKTAQELKDKPYLVLPATTYMNFTRNGDRAQYERIFFERRYDLLSLVLGECVEGKKEYIDSIINLIWAICEETTWVVPAHNNKGELCDIEYETYIDLFSSETASTIAWTYYFLADVIAEASPLVKRRMEIEIEKRIIEPYLKYDHFWYMGLVGTPSVNNWNPWINCNVLVVFAIFAKNRDIAVKGIEKLSLSTDKFIESYHEDGACDEGPGYFGAAGAALFDYLETLYDITEGEIDIFGDELIKNMARYIYRVYIGKSYYVNFADGSARPGAPAKLLARIGAAMKDENLVAFSNHVMSLSNNKGKPSVGWHAYRGLKSLFQGEIPSKPFVWPKVHWFKDNQILTARDNEGTSAGMFIAAKGGHNAESHNHNDIGSFVVYVDETPVIVDAGVETYSKKTFSRERYTIWTMQSCYHAVPTVNGVDQLAGRNYQATDVNYSHDGNTTTLSMELKNAYPADSGIDSYVRTITFNHGKELIINDKYSAESFVFNAVCAVEPVLSGDVIKLGDLAELSFDSGMFDFAVDPIELTDGRIRNDWQREYLYRLRLTSKSANKIGEMTVRITKA